jgi:hypothetical protein
MSSHDCCGGYPDFDMNGEEPYACCSVPCIGCGKNAAYTARQYQSDYGVTKKGVYYNLGQVCPASKCCDGPVCIVCVYRKNFFCRFCCKVSKVHFLDKDDFLSENTSSRIETVWFDKLWQFYLFQNELGGTCQLFFSWLRNDFPKRQCSWEFSSWDRLCLDNPGTKSLICEFNHFLHSSKMVVSHTVFSRVHRIPVKFDSFFQSIQRKRQKNLNFFLEGCYRSPFSISFERREILKQFQIGFVGTLSLRLSQSRQHNNFLIHRKIFCRIMLNLLVA